jgi:hypothetical protein
MAKTNLDYPTHIANIVELLDQSSPLTVNEISRRLSQKYGYEVRRDIVQNAVAHGGALCLALFKSIREKTYGIPQNAECVVSCKVRWGHCIRSKRFKF